MSACGLTCFLPRMAPCAGAGALEPTSARGRPSPFPPWEGPGQRTGSRLAFHLRRKIFDGLIHGHPYLHSRRSFPQHHRRVSMGASAGGTAGDSNLIFPGINIGDPYKRLGISREASEDEIEAARIFLRNKYAGHKPSVDAIQSAHDKIIMLRYHERRRPKLNLNKKVSKFTQSRTIKFIISRFETPSRIHLIKAAAAYLILGVLTVLFPTEEGPTLQVALSLIAAIYFINDRLRSQLRAFLYGAASFLVSWLLGTFLMVSVIPPLLRGPRSLEVSTSLISYILLWAASSYLK